MNNKTHKVFKKLNAARIVLDDIAFDDPKAPHFNDAFLPAVEELREVLGLVGHESDEWAYHPSATDRQDYNNFYVLAQKVWLASDYILRNGTLPPERLFDRIALALWGVLPTRDR